MTQYRLKLIMVSVAAVGIAATAMYGFVHARQAHAATPTEEKISLVAANCDILQTRLRLAQKTELAARVKRGRAYDQEIMALVSAFNSRVGANNVDAPELLQIAADLEAAVSASEFGYLYTVYADDLSNAIGSNCKKNPAVTYGWIEKARIDRAALAEKVSEIDTLIGKYIGELQELEKRFTPVINKPEIPASHGQ